jgi:hypothetical protein
MPALYNWTFWSFHLSGAGSGLNVNKYGNNVSPFAEVIFGLPSQVEFHLRRDGSGWIIFPPIPPDPAPVTSLQSPLNNLNIVGVSAGLCGLVQCTGTQVLTSGTSGVGSTSVVQASPATTAKYGNTTMQFNGAGVPTLTDLGIAFTTPSSSNVLFYLSAGIKASDQIFYNTSESGANGTWRLKATWAEYSDSISTYSISNPPVPVPGFPLGGEFDESNVANYPVESPPAPPAVICTVQNS